MTEVYRRAQGSAPNSICTFIMNLFQISLIFLAHLFLSSCFLNETLSSDPNTCFELTQHVIHFSEKIVTHDLFISPNYCTVYFTNCPTPLVQVMEKA